MTWIIPGTTLYNLNHQFCLICATSPFRLICAYHQPRLICAVRWRAVSSTSSRATSLCTPPSWTPLPRLSNGLFQSKTWEDSYGHMFFRRRNFLIIPAGIFIKNIFSFSHTFTQIFFIEIPFVSPPPPPRLVCFPPNTSRQSWLWVFLS